MKSYFTDKLPGKKTIAFLCYCIILCSFFLKLLAVDSYYVFLLLFIAILICFIHIDNIVSTDEAIFDSSRVEEGISFKGYKPFSYFVNLIRIGPQNTYHIFVWIALLMHFFIWPFTDKGKGPPYILMAMAALYALALQIVILCARRAKKK